MTNESKTVSAPVDHVRGAYDPTPLLEVLR